MVRKAVVSGQFYSGTKEELQREIALMLPPYIQKHKIKGVVAPHAGFMYSGSVAGELYASIEIPKTALILGPNHHGIGSALALSPDDTWLTPLGSVPVNKLLNQSLLANVSYLQPDAMAHAREHSLEVQLPFLQFLQPDLTISAISIGYINDFAIIENIGNGIAKAIESLSESVLIIASSDMTHYETAESAHKKDSEAIDAMLELNPEKLLLLCKAKRFSICGAIPAAIMLVACKALGARESKLVAYRTSGDVTGDNSQVVGYASLVFW